MTTDQTPDTGDGFGAWWASQVLGYAWRVPGGGHLMLKPSDVDIVLPRDFIDPQIGRAHV